MAMMLNVTGWVQNLPNGEVRGCFEGDQNDVQALIDWCHHGPAYAEVENIIVDKKTFRGEFRGFHVR